MGPKINTTKERIGRLEFEFMSEIIDNKELDTKVTVETGTLCWISGEEKAQFIKEFNELIEKYRI